MDFILGIFAKHGTNEKVLVPMPSGKNQFVMESLNKKFGGSWVRVDQMHGNGEIITFTDDMVYQGFNEKIDRYSTAIQKLY